jgi:hypothetical protein
MTFQCVGIAKIALRGDSRSQIKTRPQPKYFRFEVRSSRWGAPEEYDFQNRTVQIPPPLSKTSLRACNWVTLLPGGTLRVSQTLPPIVDPRPIVIRPRMVAPA